MTDLINRVHNLTSETAQALIIKYQDALKEIFKRDDQKVIYVAYIINVAYNYLEEKHKDETADWKSWCVLLIKKLFDKEILVEKEDIFKHIDQFLEYKKSEYDKYVSNIAMYSDEFYRDSPFVDKYIKTLPL